MVGRQGAYWEDGWNGGAFVAKTCSCQKLAGTKIVCHDFEIRLITTASPVWRFSIDCHEHRGQLVQSWVPVGVCFPGTVTIRMSRILRKELHLNLLCCIGPYINKRLGNVQICLLKMVAVFSLCFQTPLLQTTCCEDEEEEESDDEEKNPKSCIPKRGPSDEGLKGVHVRMLVPISYDAKLAVILKSVFSRPRMDTLPQAKRQVTVVLFRRKDLHKTRDQSWDELDELQNIPPLVSRWDFAAPQ